MLLSKLIKEAPDIEIESLSIDSRTARKNSVFFCLSGVMEDGHKYIGNAIENGAVCIVHAKDISNFQDGVVYIKVEDVQLVLNDVMDVFFDHASEKLQMYGVTGTNGKSTIAFTIKNILNQYKKTGYIGTIAIEYGDVKELPVLTTPDAVSLNETLAKMVENNVEALALEVSSHGIKQNRVSNVDFDIVIFTNLSHDHLDFHKTMEKYYETKRRLFTEIDKDKTAIVNVDDEYGKRLSVEAKCEVFTYGINNDADYRATNVTLYPTKTTFTLIHAQKQYDIETNMVAEFNVYNLLAVVAALHQGGLEMDQIISKINHLRQVDGRMEIICEGQPFNLIVDYAHTPDGFEKICEYAKSITPKGNKIYAVFGSAGKRDTMKRPVLGEIADRTCDMIILTEEDPRNESITDICMEIAAGIKGKFLVIESRYDAIRQAIDLANENDTVLVLAKGSETYMYREFGREEWLGDDKACREILKDFYFSDTDCE